MTPEHMNGKEIKLVTYLVYVLLAILTLVTGYHVVALTTVKTEMIAVSATLNTFPDKYVRLERYKTDLVRVETLLERIDGKIDVLTGKDSKYPR